MSNHITRIKNSDTTKVQFPDINKKIENTINSENLRYQLGVALNYITERKRKYPDNKNSC